MQSDSVTTKSFEAEELNQSESFLAVKQWLGELWTSEVEEFKNLKQNLLAQLGLSNNAGYYEIFQFLSAEDVLELSLSMSEEEEWFEELFALILERKRQQEPRIFFKEVAINQGISLEDKLAFQEEFPQFWYDNLPADVTEEILTEISPVSAGLEERLAFELNNKISAIKGALAGFWHLAELGVGIRSIEEFEFTIDNISDTKRFIQFNQLCNKLVEIIILTRLKFPPLSHIGEMHKGVFNAISDILIAIVKPSTDLKALEDFTDDLNDYLKNDFISKKKAIKDASSKEAFSSVVVSTTGAA